MPSAQSDMSGEKSMQSGTKRTKRGGKRKKKKMKSKSVGAIYCGFENSEQKLTAPALG